MRFKSINATKKPDGRLPWNERPVIVFSVIPTLTVLIAIYAGMLEIAVLIARVITDNKHPSDFKLAVCTAILSVAALTRWRWLRTHAAERAMIEGMFREGRFRPGISVQGTWIIIALVVSCGIFGAWVFEC